MPFKSKAQQGYMFAKHPEVAKEMAKKTSHKEFMNLPDKVEAKKGKKAKISIMIMALDRMGSKKKK